jgi:hypothetical protein
MNLGRLGIEVRFAPRDPAGFLVVRVRHRQRKGHGA